MRINLLPWREARRKAQRQHLGVLGGMVAVLGLLIVGAVHLAIAGYIAEQSSRNEYLKRENTRLDKEIEEIKKLKTEIAALLARKQIIERLQTDRAQPVYLLQELVQQVPGVPEVDQADGPEDQYDGLFAVQRARLDAHAQLCGLTLPREPRAGGDQGSDREQQTRLRIQHERQPEAAANRGRRQGRQGRTQGTSGQGLIRDEEIS
jgi:Tfp pilus assembly protein PilN